MNTVRKMHDTKPIKTDRSDRREEKDFQMQSKLTPMMAQFARMGGGGGHVLVIPFPVTR